MKTLLFTLEYPPFYGGVSKVYEKLVEHWPQKDHIAVLDNNNGKLIAEKWPVLKWLPSIFLLRKKINESQIDHVLVGHVLPLGIAVYILSRFKKIEYSVFLHGMDFAYALKSPKKKWVTAKILLGAKKIICLNSYVAELVENNCPEAELRQKITVVNPGIDPEIPSLTLGLADKIDQEYSLIGKTVLFSVSRLVRRKGMDKTIEALPAVWEKHPEVIYCIAGKGPDEGYLREKIGKLPEKHQKNILILGKISNEEKWTWLDLCDIFVMPSRNIDGDFEGFGIVYLEANLAGKPVIAGDSGGVKDAVVEGINGLLVDPDNTEAISSAIIKLAGNKELRERLGRQGKERALRDFRWGEQVRKIFDHINKVV